MKLKEENSISRSLVAMLLDNYRKIENEYPGYTSKKEAATLINYCYKKEWYDLSKKAMWIFGMDVLDIVPDRLHVQLKEKELKNMISSLNENV